MVNLKRKAAAGGNGPRERAHADAGRVASPKGIAALLRGAQFQLAAHEIKQLPKDAGAEVAFAGRSNAGKSSALNALTGQGALARISKTPGRTQQLVVFTLDDARRLVDLPGYGYAKVPAQLREHWGRVLDVYFRERRALKGVVLVMDVRHPLTAYDRLLLDAARAVGRDCHILLSKADKLSRSQATTALRAVEKAIAEEGWPATVQLFSALKKDGVDAARAKLAQWLG
jgi:GTP-binding protein